LRVTTYRFPTQQNLAVTQAGTPFDLMKLLNGSDTTPTDNSFTSLEVLHVCWYFSHSALWRKSAQSIITNASNIAA